MQITRNHPTGFTIETSWKTLKTPFFFPSISTVQTNHGIHDYLELLKKVSYPGFLISAYDIYHDNKKDDLIKEVSAITDSGVFTMMDSGNYEAYWKNDKNWDIKKLESILNEINIDFCFSFDVFWEEKNIDKHVKDTITYSAMTAGMQRNGVTIPLIHSNTENFPAIVKEVVNGVYPQIIGIAERELGNTLLERARLLKKIRSEVDKIAEEIPIHLLGTGNPTSILTYTLCGADMFDALEWCKNVVNPSTGHLYHFIQKELVDCNCNACTTKNVPYHLQTMTHNLIFYKNFSEEIRNAVENEKIKEILDKYLPEKIIPKIRKIVG